jgi:small conductance mechanosensitive channel
MAGENAGTSPKQLGFIDKTLDTLTSQGGEFAINLVWATIILFVGLIISRVLISILNSVLRKTKIDVIIIGFLISIARFVVLMMIFIAALKRLGLDTTSLVTLVGAAGLAIGFALQSSLQNLTAGFMLIVFKPFKNGDLVELANTTGIVEKINIFSTTLRSGDNKEITVSNGSIYTNTITNYSARDTRRIDLIIGISYESDLKKAKEILIQIIKEDPRILKDPEPVVAVFELASSSVNFAVRPWVSNANYWDVKFDLNEKIKLIFDANGIVIPYPQMSVHLNKTN